MSKIEDVAKAIAASIVDQHHMLKLDEDGMGYSDDYDNKWYDCRISARAAIEAIRSPDDAMTDAIEAQLEKWIDDQGVGVDVYLAAIDAALKEQTK